MSEELDDDEKEWEKEEQRHDRCKELFDKFDDEYVKFENIPIAERRHPRPDICALIYLHEKFGGPVDDDGTSRDAICSAEHDEVWLDWEPGKIDITEEDALYLTRCGVRYDTSNNMFGMFV
jgi:hypothetical protein